MCNGFKCEQRKDSDGNRNSKSDDHRNGASCGCGRTAGAGGGPACGTRDRNLRERRCHTRARRGYSRASCFSEKGASRMNIKFTDINATADYIGPGAIEVPMYQTEITDLVRRPGLFGQRIKQVPATGHPSRFFEETAIPAPAASAGFVDPRNIVAPLVSPTRVERSVPLKALVAQINYNLFDIELGQQQNQFAYRR